MYLAIELPFLLNFDALVLILILLPLMLLAVALGRYWGTRRMRKGDFETNPANTRVHNSFFALLAFLLAFTFGMSASRFDARRQAVINEANAIGTAILRADLYPDSDRVVLRQYFKGYLTGKISYIRSGADLKKIDSSEKVMAYYGKQLWQYASRFAYKNAPIVVSTQMVPALNQMFDSASTTKNNEILHVPQSIVIMLFLLSVVAAFFMGYMSVEKGTFDWFAGIGFCVLISSVIYITLDLDRTRRGLTRLDSAWQAILSLENQFEGE